MEQTMYQIVLQWVIMSCLLLGVTLLAITTAIESMNLNVVDWTKPKYVKTLESIGIGLFVVVLLILLIIGVVVGFITSI